VGIGRRIKGEGCLPNPFFVCGEWTGRDGAKSGRPFAGKPGREVQRYLDGVRLPAFDDVYRTEWVKEWCGEDGEFTATDFDRDLPELQSEIRACQPWLVVALGRTISQYFLGDVDLETTHGIPWYLPPDAPTRTLFDAPSQVVVFPIYSPAAGFRRPEISAAVAYDFAQLEAVISGTLTPRILFDDPIPFPDYREITTVEELNGAMQDATTIATDTEGWPWRPWSVQLTVRAGESYIIRFRNPPMSNCLVERFVVIVNSAPVGRYRWTFHNALHDIAVFRAIGIDTTELVFDDTMIMSYVLQLEPQGLKPLCARWCNMRMMHYDEVMGDAGFRLAQDWLMSALECEDFEYETRRHEEFIRQTTTPYVDKKGTTRSGRRLTVDPKLPKTALHRAIERSLRSANPRKLWADQVIDLHVAARPKYGPIWEATLDHVESHVAIQYAGRDSDGTYRLAPGLEERLRANALLDTYRADLGTVLLIERMQRTGLRADLGHFARLSGDLGFELVDIKTRLAEQLLGSGGTANVDTAFEFNANSSDQVGDLLFEHYGIQSLKNTPGGDPSTNDKVLEALEKDSHLERPIRDIIAIIREYREVYKLKSTFVDQIPNFVNRWPWDGRIHPTFRITRVVTGRLAASDPNILAMPKHGKFAKRFRAGFISGPGKHILSWDLSQIELRVLAHLSQDPVLLHAFRNDIDLHATLAHRIFGVLPAGQDESKHRRPAKAVNFGIPMGMTNIGLCLELRKNGVDIGEDDAQRWLTETMALYKEVPAYQQGKIAECKRWGYVTDIRGRRRYIGGIRSFDNAIRSEAERFAFSTPIQAGAQEIMKEAEAYVYSHILLPRWKAGIDVEPLVQIHDDLVLESGVMGDGTILPHPTKPTKKIMVFKNTELHDEMVYAMTQVPAHWLTVPIETEGSAGVNWGEMYNIKKAA
jgi:uracil-DNA glycosylase family 4